MKKWISILFLFTLTIGFLNSQNDIELRYLQSDGISIGVDENRFSRIDFNAKNMILGFSNTTLPSPIRKQFIDLSFVYKLGLSSLKLFPTVSYSTNLRTDDLNISTAYFELPIMYQLNRLKIMAKPAYDLEHALAVSGTASYLTFQELELYIQYGRSYNFNFAEERFGIGIMRTAKKLSLKSGLQIPKNEDRLFVRLLTSFSYNFSN